MRFTSCTHTLFSRCIVIPRLLLLTAVLRFRYVLSLWLHSDTITCTFHPPNWRHMFGRAHAEHTVVFQNMGCCRLLETSTGQDLEPSVLSCMIESVTGWVDKASQGGSATSSGRSLTHCLLVSCYELVQAYPHSSLPSPKFRSYPIPTPFVLD